jgi:hypothetical protein
MDVHVRFLKMNVLLAHARTEQHVLISTTISNANVLMDTSVSFVKLLSTNVIVTHV